MMHPTSWTENSDEIDRLRAINAELLAALQTAIEESRRGIFFGGDAVMHLQKSAEIMSAALARVTEGK